MIKRTVDIILSFVFLITFSPILFLVSIIIFLKIGKPILFIHKRSGMNKRSFNFYKFRTMTSKTDKNGELLPDQKRLTSFGRFLRKTSIDELPSFINVLKGDMSLVGPRPLLERYLPRYDDTQIKRLDVKPGITGLAQVKGRNSLSWTEKFSYDVYYVNNQSIYLDLKILYLTVISVMNRKGITPENEEIMPEFFGNESNEFLNRTNRS